MAGSTLLLVPTEFELQLLRSAFGDGWLKDSGWSVELCGFGLVASAARTAMLLKELCPSRAILAGIAGSLGDQLSVGHAYSFGKTVCYGIGVGTGQDHQTAEAMGWKHWQGAAGEPPIGDQLVLSGSKSDLTLLTTAASSSSEMEAELKRECYPAAVAEDMEGFSVAAACCLERVELCIVRGISNQAGDRNHANWKCEQAMAAVAEKVKLL